MNIDNALPIIWRNPQNRSVSEDTGVVNQNVNLAKLVQSRCKYCISVSNTCIVCYRLTASGLNCIDDVVGSGRTGTGTIGSTTEIIHNNSGPSFTKLKCILST